MLLFCCCWVLGFLCCFFNGQVWGDYMRRFTSQSIAAIPPRFPWEPWHQERMHFVMSEPPRRHWRSPTTSKQIFLSHHWIGATCYIIITVTNHHITPTIGSKKFQFANISYIALLLLQKNLESISLELGKICWLKIYWFINQNTGSHKTISKVLLQLASRSH